ncbi:hypothetical protein LSCM4_08286 [Leishmania orientalis]|uniref:Leucine-rich repeat protein n=1 Tax=Leishmania orientalis TaxID=2249476 RepID=A0A836KV10_9TRYP|nr:hypothetical protein LSCM4_08286 [Leishmania orientalis]
MSAHAEFAERLRALFAAELRRQGVADGEGWADKLNTYCSFVPTASVDDRSNDAGDRQRSSPSTVMVIDMTNLEVGDKPVVALCESLLKMEGPSLRGRYGDVSEWQVLWRRCGLTDRVLRHLELLLLECQRLTLLDVSANALSPEGQASLLHAAAEVACDVVLAEDARATHSGCRAREASVPSSSRSTSFPPELAERERHNQASRHRQRGGSGDVDANGCASVAHRATTLQQHSGGTKRQTSPPSTRAATSHPLRRRSPSFSGASASASPSLRSYASGSAEALQKRRAELFGLSATAASAASARAAPASAGDGRVGEGGRSGVTTTSDGMVEVEALQSAAKGSPARPSPAATPQPHRQRQPVEEAEDAREGGDSPLAAAPTQAKAHPSAAGSASREPFIDRNDQIDLTSNLSPVLDSVLDLSALMTRDGALRQAHMFGDARTVWDVLDAYESAAEQQLHRPVSHGGEASVDAATSAKLPAALLGGTTYNAITVLNLSRNHLTTLCALPATLLRLDISVNDLTELSGLQECKMLTVLNARRNHLRAIRGLERNLSLAHLFLGHNGITAVEGVAHLVLLETLDLTFNELRTQASLRMLSLCSTLRHLLLRGNPIMESGKPGFIPVLRNLCPTLLVVDEHRMVNSCLADRALAQRNWGRQPNLINTAQPYARTETLRGGSGVGASPSLLSHAAAVGNGVSVDGSTMSSLPFTSSRRREGSRPAPFATGDSDVVDERSMNLLHMLTRGVTAPTGYGDSLRSQHAAQQLAQTKKEKEAQAQAERERRLTANGRLLRGAVVKQLAEESRKYLEDTIVRRMTTAQQQQLHGIHSAQRGAGGSSSNAANVAASESMTRRGSVERNAYGGVAHPELFENPLADVMGCTVASSEKQQRTSMEGSVRDKTDTELLRRYKPRAARLRRNPSAKPPPSLTAGTQTGQPRRDQQQTPPRRTVSAGRAPSPAVSCGRALHGPVSVTRRQLAQPMQRDDEDAALATLYGGDATESLSGEAARGGGGSYAALHAAEQSQPRASPDVEVECSPISKDPQARLMTSLNTTESILHDNSRLHRLSEPLHSAYLRTATPPMQRLPSPPAQARRHPTPQGYRDPAEVEVTAIYPNSRSRSRSPRGGGGGGSGAPPKPQSQRYQYTPSRTNASSSKPSSRSRSSSAAAAASRAVRSGIAGGRGAQSGAAASSSASPARARSPSMRPLHIDDAQRARIRGWTQQLHDDTDALQDALQTIVDLLEAQRQQNMPVPESSRELPPTYLQERRRCIQIIQGSGMLQDTYVPMDVVVYYGFSKAELEGETDRSAQVVARRGGGTEAEERAWAREVAERSDVLRQVHLMGDAKTCLRYVALLVGDGRERLLQQYVDQLKESLRSVQRCGYRSAPPHSPQLPARHR